MKHRFLSTVFLFLTIFLGVGLISQAMAAGMDSGKKVPRNVLPRIVATIIALEPSGMATIKTVDGATYQVIKGTYWRLGDTVECEQTDRKGGVAWQTLDCRKAS